MEKEKKEISELAGMTRYALFKFIPTFVMAIIAMAVTGFTLYSFGVIGNTVVEREVFEQSYQRTAGLESAIARDRAVLANIEMQLADPNLDENTRFNLKSQAAAARVRIQTNMRKMK